MVFVSTVWVMWHLSVRMPYTVDLKGGDWEVSADLAANFCYGLCSKFKQLYLLFVLTQSTHILGLFLIAWKLIYWHDAIEFVYDCLKRDHKDLLNICFTNASKCQRAYIWTFLTSYPPVDIYNSTHTSHVVICSKWMSLTEHIALIPAVYQESKSYCDWCLWVLLML